MTLTTSQALATIGVMALATLLTRALPFLLFPPHRPTPAYIIYLGRVLPYATIGMLIVYCLKGVNPTAFPFGLPELLGVALVTVLQLWKRNTLLSIAGGTVFYMILVQAVFV